jgi:hypothetical protein
MIVRITGYREKKFQQRRLLALYLFLKKGHHGLKTMVLAV